MGGRPTVLVDTNGWFLPERSGLDLRAAVRDALGSAEIRAPSVAIAELDRLVAAGVPGASVARALAGKVPVATCPGRGDAALVAAAAAAGAWVLTGDRRLERELLRRGVPVLTPRANGGLVLRRPRPSRDDAAAPTVMKRTPVRRRRTISRAAR